MSSKVIKFQAAGPLFIRGERTPGKPQACLLAMKALVLEPTQLDLYGDSALVGSDGFEYESFYTATVTVTLRQKFQRTELHRGDERNWRIDQIIASRLFQNPNGCTEWWRPVPPDAPSDRETAGGTTTPPEKEGA
jgi:hypothetical protein